MNSVEELAVVKILSQFEVKDYRLIPLANRSVTHEDTKKNLPKDINHENDCKTIVLVDNVTKKFFAVFLPGNSKLDMRKVKEAIKSKKNPSVLNKELLKELTGMEPGEVCPILLYHEHKMPLFVDKRVIERERIHFGSGDALTALEMKTLDLQKLMKFEIGDFVKNGEPLKKIPLILDTDIGDDIDDAWALAMLLKMRDIFDIKLITTTHGDTLYRAELVSQFLIAAKCTDIPIGIGLSTYHKWRNSERCRECCKPGFSLQKSYPGKVCTDGIQAMIDIIMNTENVTLCAIGPLFNIAEALRRKPEIASRTR